MDLYDFIRQIEVRVYLPLSWHVKFYWKGLFERLFRKTYPNLH